jgi:hypothetical protein
LYWKKQTLSGASFETETYVHVLRRGGPVFKEVTTPAPVMSAAPIIQPDFIPQKENISLSPLTMAAISAVTHSDNHDAADFTTKNDSLHRAWEKYCGGGVGMTDPDWLAVRAAGAPDNIPPEFSGNCTHPK